ncbi:hypothetical protein SU48_03075 [Deinococcus puniceus]|uniref:Uncharacterized protein n=1 Tax=Deinococcus puniceus TaxID=1182568 RepID=A0A172T7J5_9DEIO|nr:hypothetical protein SU48_03075 [Deinococcus puniceus]
MPGQFTAMLPGVTSSSKSIFRKKSFPWLVLWALACGALALFADALGISHLRGWIVGAFFVGEVLIYGALDKAEG